MRLIGNDPWGEFGVTTSTKSLTARFRCEWSHFLLLMMLGKYSRSGLFQNCVINSWACSYHLRLESFEPRGELRWNPGWARNSKKWLGVMASKPFGFTMTWVNGREFRSALASTIAVTRTYSVTDRWFKIPCRVVLADLINSSHEPHKWGATGGLNLNLIGWFFSFSFFCTNSASFQRERAWLIFCSMATRFVPLSL